jgi:quinol monooxygenase YgiN
MRLRPAHKLPSPATWCPSEAKEKSMVVEYIRYQVPSGQHEQFVSAYKAAAKDLEASGHCLHYEISKGVEEPDNFTVRIEWDSVEGHEGGFRTSAQFPSFFAKVKPFFGQIREMKHYQVLHHGKGAAGK